MLPQRTGLSLQSPLRPLSVLVFHLLLTHSCRGQSQLIGPLQPILATVGDDIILPCHLEPAEDVSAMTLEWTRSDLNSIAVFVWRAGEHLVHVKDPSYTGRTSLFTDELKHGNISLKLSKVKPSDEGRYQCYVPDLSKGSFIELVVGAVSSPVITLAGIDEVTGGVMLDCRSEGWYPEPEVLWLDGEGNLLSAGPPETVRGPDDLYTVSSRVTVEKRHSNSFTCRVQQKNTNQTRDAHFPISSDFFKLQSISVPVITGLAVSLAVWIIMFILLLLFVVWKWRKNRIKTQRNPLDQTEKGEKKNCSEINISEDQRVTEEREREQLMTGETVQMEVLEGNGQEKSKHKRSEQQLQEEQQRREEKRREEQQRWEEKRREEQQRREEKRREEQQRKKEKRREEQQRMEEEAEKEIETIKAELGQVVEEIERKANELQIQQEELEKKKKEMERFINTRSRSYSYSLLEDKQLETAEAQLKKTNKELKRQLKSMKYESVRQLMRELWDQKQKKEKAERELKQLMTKNTELEDKQLAAEAQMKKISEELKETKHQLKNKNEEINQLKREFNKQLSDQQKKKEEAERDLEQLKTKNTEVEKQLQEEKTKREEAEKEVENLKKEMQTEVNTSRCNVLEADDSPSFHQDKSSSASQSSTTEPLIVIEVDQHGKYIRLRNTSHQDQKLGEWILQGQFNDTKPIKYTFDCLFTLRSGKTVNMWVPDYGYNYPPSDLVWKDLKHWNNRDKLHFTLFSHTEEIQHQLSL